MTEHENAQTAETAEIAETESAYWEEAVRLAELRMTEYNRIQIGYERRAVLLITFCVVIIGFLFAGEWAGWLALKFAPVLLLAFAAIRGMLILQFAEFGVQGIHPRTLADSSLFEGNTDALREYVCQEYAERIDRNQKLLARQSKHLECGRILLYLGLAGAFIVSVAEKIPPHVFG
ncbi:MAG: hypothetical protein ACR2QC_03905 [Gammaproteobacteria bacterium]